MAAELFDKPTELEPLRHEAPFPLADNEPSPLLQDVETYLDLLVDGDSEELAQADGLLDPTLYANDEEAEFYRLDTETYPSLVASLEQANPHGAGDERSHDEVFAGIKKHLLSSCAGLVLRDTVLGTKAPTHEFPNIVLAILKAKADIRDEEIASKEVVQDLAISLHGVARRAQWRATSKRERNENVDEDNRIANRAQLANRMVTRMGTELQRQRATSEETGYSPHRAQVPAQHSQAAGQVDYVDQ